MTQQSANFIAFFSSRFSVGGTIKQRRLILSTFVILQACHGILCIASCPVNVNTLPTTTSKEASYAELYYLVDIFSDYLASAYVSAYDSHIDRILPNQLTAEMPQLPVADREGSSSAGSYQWRDEELHLLEFHYPQLLAYYRAFKEAFDVSEFGTTAFFVNVNLYGAVITIEERINNIPGNDAFILGTTCPSTISLAAENTDLRRVQNLYILQEMKHYARFLKADVLYLKSASNQTPAPRALQWVKPLVKRTSTTDLYRQLRESYISRKF